MEVLAGARDNDHRDRLRRLLARCEHVPVEGLDDFESAAELYRMCRNGGETVQTLTDCLITVVAKWGHESNVIDEPSPPPTLTVVAGQVIDGERTIAGFQRPRLLRRLLRG